jgi:hypothetical protein
MSSLKNRVWGFITEQRIRSLRDLKIATSGDISDRIKRDPEAARLLNDVRRILVIEEKLESPLANELAKEVHAAFQRTAKAQDGSSSSSATAHVAVAVGASAAAAAGAAAGAAAAAASVSASAVVPWSELSLDPDQMPFDDLHKGFELGLVSQTAVIRRCEVHMSGAPMTKAKEVLVEHLKPSDVVHLVVSYADEGFGYWNEQRSHFMTNVPEPGFF